MDRSSPSPTKSSLVMGGLVAASVYPRRFTKTQEMGFENAMCLLGFVESS